ncbi:PilN domain-containing protein [Luteimonas terrae]|uniref:General secretion pathway protein L n=1 Tax=Luteimonas terrae TaxID=1530191 RepID=A0ABU1XU68_9GAMM|nr:PilN domain-containing protein [Luteimonas terrae]MDR7192303.1 general secretion pathway protein L [Luteimonas terrae]
MSATPASPAERAPGRRAWRLDGRTSVRVRTFVSWWGAALSAWLPARVRELFGLASRRLLLVGNGADIALQLQDADGVRDLANVPRASFDDTAGDPLATLLAPRTIDLPRWLLLPARTGLRRQLTLPEAAGDRLHDVLGFEIDRQTPFAAADVRYDHRVLGRRGDGQIDVELVVVPRAAIDAQLAALGPLAPMLAGIDLAGDTGPLGVNLIDDARRRRREDPQRPVQLLILGIAVLLTVFGLWQMRENRSAAADALEARVASEATRARAASAQRQQLTDLREGMAFLQAQRAARPLTVAVLDELARRLPDSTSLEKAAIEGDRVLLIGLSTEASALVGQLSGSTLWRAPALAGALQNDPRTRADRFTLTAELVPPAAVPAPAPSTPQEPVRADDAR